MNTGLLTATFILAGTFNVIFPFVLGWWIIKKKRTNWKLFGVGVLTFVGSQIFHIPLVNGLTRAFSSGLLPHVSPGFAPFFNAIVLGLLAGIIGILPNPWDKSKVVILCAGSKYAGTQASLKALFDDIRAVTNFEPKVMTNHPKFLDMPIRIIKAEGDELLQSMVRQKGIKIDQYSFVE